jgi:site-specific DNA recombinase
LRAALYTRVSTDVQVEEGFSLDAQLHRLRAYCESQGWTISDVYTDEGISAKNTERPQLQRMLSDIRDRKIDVVLVYRLDRLTRSVLDLHELLQEFERYNVGFKSATEVFDTTTAMGRLFITIVAALAQWERENLGERVRFGQAQMVREGRYFGNTPPYGYDLRDGELFINPIEAHVIRTIFDLYLSGNGMSRIVKHLNDPSNHIPHPHGSDHWSMKVINTIVKNPVYCGYVRYGNKTKKRGSNHELVVTKSTHEPIIEEHVFNRAQSLMEQRRTSPPRSGTGVHPLVGVLRCGLCGGPMIGRTAKAGTSGRIHDYHGYMCNTRRHKRTCAMKMWKSNIIEQAVIDEVEKIARETIKHAEVSIPVEEIESEQEQIQIELSKLKAQRKKLMQAFRTDIISADDLKESLDDIREDEQKLEERLASVTQKPYASFTMDDIKSLKKAWKYANPQERREMIRAVVDTAWVYEDGTVRVDLRGGF